jgi:hypothetical protein
LPAKQLVGSLQAELLQQLERRGAGERFELALQAPWAHRHLSRRSSQTHAFMAGVYGVYVGSTNHAVYVDDNGQLGQLPSSRRYKEEIADIGERSDALLELRPVSFRYRKKGKLGARPLQFGLIAEEVAEIFPELVIYGSDGRPQTVRYNFLSSLLLSELKKQQQRLEELEAEVAHLRQAKDEAHSLEARLARLEELMARSPGALAADPRRSSPLTGPQACATTSRGAP